MKWRVVAGVLTGALFIVVAYVFAQPPGGSGGPMPGPGMHGPMNMRGPMMRRMISERLDRALDRASVAPEQRVKIYEARDQVFAAFDAQRPDPRAMREQMLTAFEGAQLTQAQLDTLHQQQEQRYRAIRTAFDRAILDVHATLTPAQRKIVAEYVRNNPMHWPGLRHRADGPAESGPRGGPDAPGPR